jgi:hypothetical protein
MCDQEKLKILQDDIIKTEERVEYLKKVCNQCKEQKQLNCQVFDKEIKTQGYWISIMKDSLADEKAKCNIYKYLLENAKLISK